MTDEATYEITSLIIGLTKNPVYIAAHLSLINTL